MNIIKIVNGVFAVLRDDEVVGVVERSDNTQWGFYPLRGGVGIQYVPLYHALEVAQKYGHD